MTTDTGEIRFGRFRLDPVRRVLRADEVPVRLGARAIDVLLELVRHRDRIVSKDQLLDSVWPGLIVEENNLQVQVSALRKLLGPQTIATIPGRGYQFIADIEVRDAGRPRAVASTNASTDTSTDAAPNRGRNAAARRRLPVQRSALVGREDDLADLCALLPAHALVTLTGPGGIGKTRLALAAAAALQPAYADGVHWIDLASVVDAQRAPAVVAAGLGIDLLPGVQAEAVIADALRGQSLLLVLDNCEHLLDVVAPLVDALLRQAAGVHVLATSQAPLRLGVEQVLRVEALSLPAGNDIASADEASHYGALALFVMRAGAAQPGFALQPDTVQVAVEICRRLDGMPLAIELAAARLPLLGLTGLRDRLDERLQLLTRGASDAPSRQQTLRATLEWSHALLSPAEQTVFRRLGVFAGGFSLALAQRVAADPLDDAWLVLDSLGALVDRSLVVASVDGEPRYHLLESARAFALERLAAAGEMETLQLRRAEALREQVEAFDAATAVEPRFDRLVQACEPELDNLRAALRWAMDAPGQRELALALLAGSSSLWTEIDPFGDVIAHYRRAREWLDDAVPPLLAARFRIAIQAVARLRMLSSAHWRDEAWLALQTYRRRDDRIGLYKALCALGGATRDVIDADAAGALLEEAARIEDPAWSPRLRSRRQLALEWWHDLGGRFEAAREAGRAHVALAGEAGATGEIAALSNLADTEFELGNAEEAVRLCRRAIARAASLDRPAAAAHAYGNMVPALLQQGDPAEAEAVIRAGRALLVRGLGMAFVLLMPLALLVLRRGELELAARLVGSADRAYAADGGYMLHPPERRMRETIMTALRERLSENTVAALLREGAAWPEAEAFARAGIAEGGAAGR